MRVEGGGGGTERGRETGNRQKKGAPSPLFSDFVTRSYAESWDHLVKNHESQSRAIESQLKNTSTRGLMSLFYWHNQVKHY